jgi:hypothetical protein
MDIMIDLETLATTKDASIIQMAAVRFDRWTNELMESFMVNVNLTSCLLSGFRVDPKTVEWWRGQKEAQETLYSDPVTIESAISTLCNFIIGCQDKVHVWSHGLTFDVAILEHAMNELGVGVPWRYDAPRDTRTIFELAQEMGWEKPARSEDDVHHCALGDARYQAQCVQSAHQYIRIKTLPNFQTSDDGSSVSRDLLFG